MVQNCVCVEYGNVCNVAYLGVFIYLLICSICVSVCGNVWDRYAMNVFACVVVLILFCIFCFHRASWHSLDTLTKVFPCFFLGCKANARV
jgi:predicted membrane channel-forming protein YqfA (hemolysin III family)